MLWATAFLRTKRAGLAQPASSLAVILTSVAIAIVRAFAHASDEAESVLQKKQAQSNRPVLQSDALGKAAALVMDALYYEISGESERRNQLLQRHAILSPILRRQWHSGKIQSNGQWIRAEDQIRWRRMIVGSLLMKSNERELATTKMEICNWRNGA